MEKRRYRQSDASPCLKIALSRLQQRKEQSLTTSQVYAFVTFHHSVQLERTLPLTAGPLPWRMSAQGFHSSCSPSFEPLTDGSFSYSPSASAMPFCLQPCSFRVQARLRRSSCQSAFLGAPMPPKFNILYLLPPRSVAFHCAVALYRPARLLFLAVVSSSDFFPGIMHIAMLYYRQSRSGTYGRYLTLEGAALENLSIQGEEQMQPHPFVRIITFGPLELFGREEPVAGESASRYVPLSIEKLNGRGATSAFTLLKVLLCQPQRHAPRDQLMGLLWPEYTPHKAGARLDDAASVLRTLLRPASGDNLLEDRHGNRDSGNSYHLAPYPLIWIDPHAFERYVPQACRLERFGD